MKIDVIRTKTRENMEKSVLMVSALDSGSLKEETLDVHVATRL